METDKKKRRHQHRQKERDGERGRGRTQRVKGEDTEERTEKELGGEGGG